MGFQSIEWSCELAWPRVDSDSLLPAGFRKVLVWDAEYLQGRERIRFVLDDRKGPLLAFFLVSRRAEMQPCSSTCDV